MSKPSISNPVVSVKNQSKFPATKFVPLLIQHDAGGDEIFFAPVCGRCGKPVLDLRLANVSTVGGGDVLEVLSHTAGVKTSLLSGRGYVFHKGCDAPANKPWTDALSVLRPDQRREFERRAA